MSQRLRRPWQAGLESGSAQRREPTPNDRRFGRDFMSSQGSFRLALGEGNATRHNPYKNTILDDEQDPEVGLPVPSIRDTVS